MLPHSDPSSPFAAFINTMINISSCELAQELVDLPYILYSLKQTRRSLTGRCVDLNSATWNLDHLRKLFAFFTMERCNPWPVKDLWINLAKWKTNRKGGRNRKKGKLLFPDWRYIQPSDFFMHTWASCWQPWKLSTMDCCTAVSNLDGNQWQAPFDSQIMTSTLQATARHSPTSPTCFSCFSATKWRVRG